MKSVLLVICALGYGFLPVVADLQYVTLFTLFIPFLLGLIYFVLHQHDWPRPLVPSLFACMAVGRVAGFWWLNSRHGRVGPMVDAEVWVFGGLGVVGFAFAWWRRVTGHSEIPTETNPKAKIC